MLGLKRGTVVLCDHDPKWEQVAHNTITVLMDILGAAAIDIQHVGSTAIKGIKAKPIIDIAVAVEYTETVMPHVPALERAGIIFRGSDHPGQLLLVVGDFENDTRTHHIHVVEQGSDAWRNYVNFRDYLNAHPDKAREYEALKIELLAAHAADRGAYTMGKQVLIDRFLDEARAWRKSNTR